MRFATGWGFVDSRAWPYGVKNHASALVPAMGLFLRSKPVGVGWATDPASGCPGHSAAGLPALRVAGRR